MRNSLLHVRATFSRNWLMSASLLVLLGSQACAQDAAPIPKDSWVEFASPDKRFKVLMPGKPELQKKPMKGVAPGTKLYLVELKSSAFVVSTLDIPAKALAGLPLDHWFRGAGQGFADRIPGGKIDSSKKIEIDGSPGREIVVKAANKGLFVVRMYLVDCRLYLLGAGGSDVMADNADLAKFLSSFKLKHAVNAAATSFDGLLGYWSFDEADGKVAKDGAGGGHDAVIHGAKRVEGKRGKALEFDGKAHLSFGPARRFDFANPQKLSIAGWFQTTNTREGTLLHMSNPRLVNPSGKPYEFVIGFRNSNFLVHSPDRRGVAREPTTTSKLKFDDGRWHHFAVLMNVDRFLPGIYIDGEPVLHTPTGTDLEPFATPVRTIGAGFQGRLDELAIFNRHLKPAEIQALAGKDYGFEDKPQPPLKLAAELEWADPVELHFEANQNLYQFGFDPSGKYLVGGEPAWDTWTGKLTFSYRGVCHEDLVRGGKLLMQMGGYPIGAVLAFDLDTHESKHVVETGATSFCLSHDEKYVFAMDRKTMRKVDLDTCRVLESWPLPRSVDEGTRHGRDVYCARAEGVAICDSKGIMMLSAKNASLLWDRPLKDVIGVALPPDGHHLACLVADGKDTYKVHLIDVKSGKTLHTLAGAEQLASRLAYVPNGKYLAVASVAGKRGQIDFWNVAQQQLMRTVKHTRDPEHSLLPAGACLRLSFSPDGQKLAAYTSGGQPFGMISLIDIGSALRLSADQVKALDARKNPLPDRKFDKDFFKPRPRKPFNDDAATKLQFKDGKVSGFHRFTDVDPIDRDSKSQPVKLFLLPLEAGQTYRFEITPNLGETWEYNQYRMRVEDEKGKTVASNMSERDHSSRAPIPGRLTLTAPQAGTYRLVVCQQTSVRNGFTLSVSPAKDAKPPR
jgi:hypothetical protein